MMKQGEYFERVDGKNISDANVNTTCRVRMITNRDDGSFLINGKYIFREEEIRQISCAEFKKGKNRGVREKNKEEVPLPPIETTIKKGSYVRKKNWELFKDKFQNNRPTLLVQSVNRSNCYLPNQIRINGLIYNVESLVELTLEEHLEIDIAFNGMQLSQHLEGFGKETSCIRESTGVAKVAYNSEVDVLRKLWVIKHNHPDKPFQAYRCPFCSTDGAARFHVGKRPLQETLDKLQKNIRTIPEKDSSIVRIIVYILAFIVLVMLGCECEYVFLRIINVAR